MRQFGSTKGQAVIFATLTLVLTFGALGLVVDLGWASWRQEVAKNAAQSAAMAGAIAARGFDFTCGVTGGVPCQAFTPCPSTLTSTVDPIQVACMYAQQNGFTNGGNGGKQTVTIAANLAASVPPPVSGYRPAYWVSATVSEQTLPTFAAVLGLGGLSPSARATAGVFVSSGGCIYSLNPTASGAISMGGNTHVTTGCGVFDNSNSPSALSLAGGATIQTTGGTTTQVVGNWNGGGSVTPAPNTGVPSIIDPYSLLQPPAYTGCDRTGVNLGSHENVTITHSADFNTPYVICAGSSGAINLGSQSRLTLTSGLYVVDGGTTGTAINLGAQSSLSGSGVTLYIRNGGVTMEGGATAQLSPPAGGDWMGVLFFQDRNNTSPATLVGGTSQSLNGLLYFPKAALTYTGGSSSSGSGGAAGTTTTLVADTLSLQGNSYIANPATTFLTSNQSGTFLFQ